MGSVEENKKIVMRWFELGLKADPAVADLLSPDCTFFVSGDMPFSGWKDIQGFFEMVSDLQFDPRQYVYRIGRIIGEGDEVWVEATGDVPLKNGNRYNNNYVFLFTIRDGKIVKWCEIADTLHSYRVGSNSDVTGPALDPRPQLVSNPTVVLGPVA